MSSRLTLPSRARRRLVAAAAVSSLLALTACGGDDAETSTSSGEGVAYGATIEEYQEALADIDPITVAAQASGAPGSMVASYVEEYAKAVEEWSGGKITFEIEYANAIAAPAEVGDAVADGTLDFSYSAPTYQPEGYPVANSLLDLTFNVVQSPAAGAMQLLAISSDVANNTPEIIDELESKNLYPLIPVYTSGLDGLLCTEPRPSLADMKGTTTRAGARVHAKQIEKLGMNAASLDFAELYEGLQRGVVDCSVTSAVTAMIGGLPELAPHIIIDPQAGFAAASGGSLIINKELWDSFPLAARQLLHDRLDVYFKYLIKGQMDSFSAMVELAESKGGGFQPFADDARAALQEANEGILDEVRADAGGLSDPSAFVDKVLDASKKWQSIITEDLGFDPELSPSDFVGWYAEQDLSTFDGFTERLFDEVINNRRPE